MEALGNQCASQSSGAVNQLFGLLIQTILAAQCNVSPDHMWPEDYGVTALKKGKRIMLWQRVIETEAKQLFYHLLFCLFRKFQA